MTPLSRVDGQLISSSSEKVPVGWRFIPTDVQILAHFLPKKNGDHAYSAEPIQESDIYGCSPDELASKEPSLFQGGGDAMYFFTPLNHEGGLRKARKAGDGSWKATDGRKPINEVTAELQASNLALEDETNIIQGNKDTFCWNQLGDLPVLEDGYPELKLSQSTTGDDSQKMIGKEPENIAPDLYTCSADFNNDSQEMVRKELENNALEVEICSADIYDDSQEMIWKELDNNIPPEVDTCSADFIDNSQGTKWKELVNIVWEEDPCSTDFNTN